MKSEKFPGNSGSLYIERTFHREGPPVVYVVCYKGSAQLHTDPKSILKRLKFGKGTPGRVMLDEFLGTAPAKEADPQENTKMIT